MFREEISVGSRCAIVQAMSSRFARKCPQITSSGIFLARGSDATMDPSDGPLILASADLNLAAYAGSDLHLDVTIDFILQMLRKRRKSLAPKDVIMCMHFGDGGNESFFKAQAHRAGLQHAWVGNSLDQHPRLVRARKNGSAFDVILVKRTI